jgi:hypothetical protein
VIGFLATIIGGTDRQLDASTEASGPHVFAVRFNAVRLTALPRPPQPAQRRDVGQRPSEQDGMAIDMPLFRPSGKAKYFLFWGLTRFPKIGTDLPVGSICRGCSRHFVISQPV